MSKPKSDTTCREKLRAMGLPFPKSGCEKCGSILRPGWQCAEQPQSQTAELPEWATKELLVSGLRRDIELIGRLDADLDYMHIRRVAHMYLGYLEWMTNAKA